MTAPARPFVAIVGGSKVSSKIGVLEALLLKCNKLIIGCAPAFSLLSSHGMLVAVVTATSMLCCCVLLDLHLARCTLCSREARNERVLGRRGGMVFTFLAARGLPVGASLVEADKIDTARQLEALVRHLQAITCRHGHDRLAALQSVAVLHNLHAPYVSMAGGKACECIIAVVLLQRYDRASVARAQ